MRISLLFLILLFSAPLLPACSRDDAPPATPISDPIKYLALGDSYTIGESVNVSERWPVQLAAQMREQGVQMEDPEIIARTGWTTRNLLDAMDDRMLKPEYDLVSILIGVNNQYQGRTLAEYQEEYEIVLQRAIALAKGDSSRVFVVSIPDYGFTPFGASNQEAISAEIDIFNHACREITERYGVPFYNITPISREGLDRDNFVALDGLHPSGPQYKAWVDQILESVIALL